MPAPDLAAALALLALMVDHATHNCGDWECFSTDEIRTAREFLNALSRAAA